MRVNEIFYSLQGEGYYTGTPAVFIRLSGCNLKCPFCDTKHQQGREMSEEDIISFVEKQPGSLVVITGGEPSLQLTYSFVRKLHDKQKYVAVETNGTKKLPQNVDWITISPKQDYVGNVGRPAYNFADEVKVVFDGVHEISDFGIHADYYFIQPCDTGDAEKNKEITNKCVEYVKNNTKWRLSLQTQKILNVQ